jgi:hypothetical protein
MPDSDPTDIPRAAPADRVDALYGLPLDEFTPQRDALAKELRTSGERDAAAWVKGLRKPSAAAWLVNQLARTQTKETQRLLAAGEDLRAAHARLVAGQGDPDELADAGDEHSGAVQSLLCKAPGLLDSEGRGPSAATLEKVEQTLRALAVDERAQAAFSSGRLTREQRVTGLGLGFPTSPGAAPAKRRQPDRTSRRAQAKAALDEARARHRSRREELAERQRELREAERDAARAQRRVDKAAAALDAARENEARAAEAVKGAEAALKAL